jgi:type IV pilus assembly protein PilM
VLVSIGADMTVVAVRRQGIPLFIRSLTMGGARLTESIANTMHMELAVAERIKRGAVPADVPQLAQARKALGGDIRDLAEDVRATVDFFLAQAEGSTIDRLLVTGGAAQTAGLADAIAGNLPCEVMGIAPFAGLPHDKIDLDPEALSRAAACATTAVGLALWPVGSPMIRLSILPEEIAQARQARRVRQMAVAGTLVVAVLLGMGGAYRELQVRSAEHDTKVLNAQAAALTGDVATLQASTTVHNSMLTRAGMVTSALKGDVDWVRVLGQLSSVMPAQVHITSFTGTRATGHGSTGIGTVTFSVTGPGDAKNAAQWIEALQKDPNFQTTWVSGISINPASPTSPETASFSSTANITPASQSSRWQKVSS